jgi:aminoglycoside phosphotransferase family enzyme/predicted kinase
MEIARLIDALKQPTAYPAPRGDIEVRQTHISVVFLVGDTVYKIKKPLNLGFLDFSTLDRRRYFCEQEVLLNRRLAPDVYLGIVPICLADDGVHVEGTGAVIEWAVKMRRLPDNATLEARLARGEAGLPEMQRIARRVAEFHAKAARSEYIASFGSFPVVAGNARENFEQSLPEVGRTVHPRTFERCQERTEELLHDLKGIIAARAARGMPCDTHGDLHLDHVYLFDKPPPHDVAIVDCIEFNERFRYADPVADAAFLVMDLKAHRFDDLASAFATAYLRDAQDAEGSQLMSFYSAYRAVVRAKVEGIKLREAEVPEDERHRALIKSQKHWLLALRELELPSRRPMLVLVGGLPGTGKSTLARELATRSHFVVLRSDEIRKQLAGVSPLRPQSTEFQHGIYTEEWSQRTYLEMQRRADVLLFEGRRVLIDAAFHDEAKRQSFVELAKRWCVPMLWLECRAEPQVVQKRLANRRGDPSDADWAVYQKMAALWSPPTEITQPYLRIVDTSGALERSVQQARQWLTQAGCDSP